MRWLGGLLACCTWAATSTVWATLSMYVDPEDIARRAPLAIEGQVLSSRSGFDPVTGRLSTYVTLQVDTVHRGPRNLERVVLREIGGEFEDLIHDVDAVPRYEPGERVLAFLEPARDGALRTFGMHFGKFTIAEPERGSSTASRDTGGAGRFASRGGHPHEQFRLADLIALAASGRPERRRHDAGDESEGRAEPGWRATPPEWARVLWDTPPRDEDDRDRDREAEGGVLPFVLMSASPARWYETDAGSTLSLDVERARNPLGDPTGAVDAVRRALEAWTDVPESRLRLAIGNANAAFTSANTRSPAASFPPANVVLFGDPYDDIPDPSGCSGILAIGGYWSYSTTGPTVNGQTFRRASRMYVIFNDGFECFLGSPDNLAEVAAHEIGHGVGFGHTAAPDAIMRASASGAGRGPRLGDDDRDAAHCVYPHTIAVTAPNGGETWNAGTVRDIRWSASAEAGLDAGTVDVDLSADGGATWTSLVRDTANDGAWTWSVARPTGSQYRVRVARPNRLAEFTPPPFPTACSGDRSDANFSLWSPPRPGVVPDGTGGPGIAALRRAGGDVLLSWGGSCSPDATAYAVYQGTLAALRSGVWDLVPRSCGAGPEPEAVVPVGPDDLFFVVAPLAGGFEGGLGTDGWGAPRPAAAAACAPPDPLGATCP